MLLVLDIAEQLLTLLWTTITESLSSGNMSDNSSDLAWSNSEEQVKKSCS